MHGDGVPAVEFDLQAHRGGLGLTVENTLAAFQRALEVGVRLLARAANGELNGTIVGEFIGGNRGIGYLILSGQFSMDTELVFATLLSITIITSLGIALINMGRDSDALPFLEKALAIFEEANQPYFHVFTLVHLGNAELGLGNPDQARALLEKAHAEAGRG